MCLSTLPRDKQVELLARMGLVDETVRWLIELN